MAELRLKNKNLRVSAELRARIFGDAQYALGAFKPEHRLLLLSGVDNAFFSKMHQAEQYFLKQVSAQGEVSLGLHELELDHGLELADATPRFEIQERTGILKIYFS